MGQRRDLSPHASGDVDTPGDVPGRAAGGRFKRLREAPAGDDQGGLRGLRSEQDRANGNRGGRRGAGSAVDGMAGRRLCAARAGIGCGWDIRRGESRRASTNP